MCCFLGGIYPVQDVGGLDVFLQEHFGLGTP